MSEIIEKTQVQTTKNTYRDNNGNYFAIHLYFAAEYGLSMGIDSKPSIKLFHKNNLDYSSSDRTLSC